MKKPFLFIYFLTALFLFPLNLFADCYRDCMSKYGCWNSMGESENRSFCSGMTATCSTECRQGGAGGKSYGAIAYSAKDQGYGYSDGWENRKKAEQNAMKYCKQNGKSCKVMAWFYNSCGAVAADGKKTGWGQADSKGEAGRQALARCKKSGGKNCQVKTAHCSG